jgi:hypothetical protein
MWGEFLHDAFTEASAESDLDSGRYGFFLAARMEVPEPEFWLSGRVIYWQRVWHYEGGKNLYPRAQLRCKVRRFSQGQERFVDRGKYDNQPKSVCAPV